MRASRATFGGFDVYGPFAQRVSKWLVFSFLISFFQVIFAAAPIMVAPAQAVSNTYNTYNAIQYWVVPEGVIQITVTMYGGSGGKGGLDGKSWAGTVGYRGKVTGTISVQPGDTITIAIGGGGVNGQSGVGGASPIGSGSQAGTNPLSSAYNGGTGGGAGYTGSSGAGAGGGAASVLHISGRGYVVAAGAGGSSGGNNITTTNDATRSSAVPSSTSTRTRGNNGSSLTGANAANAVNPVGGGNVDGSGSGGGGGGYVGGDALAPAFDGVDNSEIYGYGGSAGTNSTVGLTGSFSLTASYDTAPTLVTSGCHNTTTGWSNYGCGADGSITIDYAPTPLLSQTDSSTASVQSNAAGTVYLVRDTQTISTLAALDALASTVMKKVTVTANTATSLSLSGLSPGAYVALAYDSAAGMLSTTTKNTVAVGGDCVPQISTGLTVSHAMTYGYCLISFLGGTGTWTPPSGIKNVSFLAVGGGGGGGENGASGGGGGAMYDASYLAVTPGVALTVVVGAGGAGGATAGVNEAQGSTGGSSQFATYVANGGSGGLGGGGRAGGVGGTGGTSNGGTGGSGASTPGGAPGAGSAGPTTLIFGTARNFGGGGGGGDWQYGTSAGGAGGGGAGGVEMQQTASFTNALPNAGGAGLANTGGGGGGGATNYGFGGRGGSGIVVVRYLAPTYKTSAPTNPGMNYGETTTLTTTGTPYSGITRKMQWQASYDTGSTWSNIDTATIGSTASYKTPIETVVATTAFQFRVIITDTTTTYTFTTISDTSTLTFLLVATETDTAVNLSGSQFLSTLPVNSPTGAVTIEVWAKPNGNSCQSGGYGNVVYKTNAYNIFCSGGYWYANTGDGSSIPLNTAKVFPVRVVDGAWVHLAMTINGSSMLMYFNGQLVETGTAVTVTANSSPWYVGSQGSPSNYFNGMVDEFRVWSGVRTEAQIKSDMDNNPTITDPNLLTYYDFNEGSGNIAYNRDDLYISPSTNYFTPNTGNITWSVIESTTTTDSYTVVQFPRSIITQKGGWKIPVQVKTAMTLIVGGGGGGGINSGGGGAGGGGLKGLAALKSSKGPAKIKVGMGGIPSLAGNNATGDGRAGLASILSTTDGTVTAQVNGGAGGGAHWVGAGCSGSGTTTSAAIGGTVQAGYSGITDTTTYVGGTGGAVPTGSGNAGLPGGAGFTSSIFFGSHLFGGGAGSGSWSTSTVGGLGGGDSGNARGGAGGNGTSTSGEAGFALSGNGGGGAGNTSCSVIGSQGGSGTIYLKYLNLTKPTIVGPTSDTYTVGTRYKFAVNETVTNSGLTRTFQWQISADGGTSWSNAAAGTGALTSAYTTDTLTVGMNGPLYQFRCEVTESDSSSISVFATSDTATLTLLTSPSISGADSLTTTYGTAGSVQFTAVDGLPTRKFSTMPGIYGGLMDYSLNGIGYETMTFTTETSGNFSSIYTYSNGQVLLGGSLIVANKYVPVLAKIDTFGNLDSTFGTGGKFIFPTNIDSLINNITVDTPTGLIYVAGQASYSPNYGRWFIGRLNSNGTLDNSFAGVGYETLTVNGAVTSGNDLKGIFPQANGKIYVTGSLYDTTLYSGDTSTVARFNYDGSIDTSFATNGFAKVRILGGNSRITDFKILSSGKILVAGAGETTDYNSQSVVGSARFNSNGTLDATYGTNGVAAFNVPCTGSCGQVGVGKIASDNSIYFVSRNFSAPYAIWIQKSNSNGVADTTFAVNGVITESLTTNATSSNFLSLNFLSSGRLNISSLVWNGSFSYQKIYQYDLQGARIQTFGNGGVAVLNSTDQGISTANMYDNFIAEDSSNSLWWVGSKNNRPYVGKIVGNTFGNISAPSTITYDTSVADRFTVRVDTTTPAGAYYSTIFVTDSATASAYKSFVVVVKKAPGIVLTVDTTTVKAAGFDTSTYTQIYSTTGLVAGDTITPSFTYYGIKGTYSTTPNLSDTYTIYPKIDTITNGTTTYNSGDFTSTVSNYLSVTYVNGKLVVTKGKRPNFAIIATDSTTAGGKPSNFIYAQAGASQKIGFSGVLESATETLTVSGANCAISALDSFTVTTTNGAAATCTLNASIASSANYDSAVASSVILYFISYTNSRDNQTPGGGAIIGLSGGSPLDFISSLALSITGFTISPTDRTTVTISGTGFGAVPNSNVVRAGRSYTLVVNAGLSTTTSLVATLSAVSGLSAGTTIGRLSVNYNGTTVYSDAIWVATS